jgi:uncharacterized coiled-coil protein SlyX
MSTEERITLLDQRLTKAEGSIPILNTVLARHQLNSQEMTHDVTIFLGIASRQEHDIKEIEAALSRVETRLDGIEQRLERMESHFDERLDAIVALLSGNQPKPPEP